MATGGKVRPAKTSGPGRDWRGACRWSCGRSKKRRPHRGEAEAFDLGLLGLSALEQRGEIQPRRRQAGRARLSQTAPQQRLPMDPEFQGLEGLKQPELPFRHSKMFKPEESQLGGRFRSPFQGGAASESPLVDQTFQRQAILKDATAQGLVDFCIVVLMFRQGLQQPKGRTRSCQMLIEVFFQRFHPVEKFVVVCRISRGRVSSWNQCGPDGVLGLRWLTDPSDTVFCIFHSSLPGRRAVPPQRENAALPRLILKEMNGVLRDHSQGNPCILRGTPTCRGIIAPALPLQRPTRPWSFMPRCFIHSGLQDCRTRAPRSRSSAPERGPARRKIRQESDPPPRTLAGTCRSSPDGAQPATPHLLPQTGSSPPRTHASNSNASTHHPHRNEPLARISLLPQIDLHLSLHCSKMQSSPRHLLPPSGN